MTEKEVKKIVRAEINRQIILFALSILIGYILHSILN